MSPSETIALGSFRSTARWYHRIAWPASRGHPTPCSYLLAIAVIAFTSPASARRRSSPKDWPKRESPAANGSRAIDVRNLRGLSVVVRPRPLIGRIQVLRRFFLGILRIVFRSNRLAILVDGPLALAGDVEDPAQVDVGPDLSPFWLK